MIARIFPALLIATLALPALADDKADIEARNTAFEEAFNAGDGAAVGALYTEDAQVLPPGGAVVEGRDAIAEMWQGAIDSGFADLDLLPGEVEVFGDTAVETASFTGTAGDAPSNGKYIVVWKKVDGEWYMHRDIWNDNPAE